LLEKVGLKKKKKVQEEKKVDTVSERVNANQPHKGSKNKPFECDSDDPSQCWCCIERDHICGGRDANCWCRNDPRINLTGPDAQLLEAAFRGTLTRKVEGDMTVLQQLLERKADVNVFDRSGITALHYAARAGRKADVKALIKQKADPMIADISGNTPLHFAALFASSWKAAEPLKQSPGQVSGCKFCFGKHQLAKCPFLDSVKQLAKKGKDAKTCQTRSGNTPLQTLEEPGIEYLKLAKEREAESLHLPEALEMIKEGRDGVERLKLVAELLK